MSVAKSEGRVMILEVGGFDSPDGPVSSDSGLRSVPALARSCAGGSLISRGAASARPDVFCTGQENRSLADFPALL